MAANPIPAPELHLTTEQRPEAVIVHGSGKINASTADILQSTIRSVIPDTKRIVLDLTGVDYVDSTGLGTLVGVYMAANRADCVLEISNPKQRVRDLLKITRLASIFEGTGENYFGGM